jgi:type IV pilus assembly protein PilO
VDRILETFAAQSQGVRLAVAGAIFAIIAGGYFYLFFLPKSEELGKARETLRSVETKLAESRKTAAQLPRFKAEVEQMNREFVVALAQLPEAKEIPDLLAQVSRVGQDSGLDVLSFKPGAERPEALYASIPVQMKTTGTFHQIVTFFDRVSRLPRIVTVTDVQLTDPKEANGRIGLSASFNATTYRFLSEAEVADRKAKAAAAAPKASPSER